MDVNGAKIVEPIPPKAIITSRLNFSASGSRPYQSLLSHSYLSFARTSRSRSFSRKRIERERERERERREREERESSRERDARTNSIEINIVVKFLSNVGD